MKDRIQVALNKLKEAKQKKIELSLVDDYKEQFNELKFEYGNFEIAMADINQTAEDLYFQVEDVVYNYNILVELVGEIENLADKFNETIYNIQSKSDDLGLPPEELMDNYTEALNLVEKAITSLQFKQVSGNAETLLKNNGASGL